MFRELRRKKQKLADEACFEVLKNETRGVLSVSGDDGYPYAMPMNHYYNEEDGCIYFHSGKGGYRLECIEKNNKVSFCVFDKGSRNGDNWALNVKSVIVFGRIETVEDMAVITDISTRLSLKFTRDEEYIKKEIADYAKATLILKLTPEHICGKLVNES